MSTHLHPEPKLRMCGTALPPPLTQFSIRKFDLCMVSSWLAGYLNSIWVKKINTVSYDIKKNKYVVHLLVLLIVLFLWNITWCIIYKYILIFSITHNTCFVVHLMVRTVFCIFSLSCIIDQWCPHLGPNLIAEENTITKQVLCVIEYIKPYPANVQNMVSF